MVGILFSGKDIMRAKALQTTLDHVLKIAGHLEDDAELLHRFVTRQDKTALELLILRHKEVVAGVCWRILGEQAAVDEASQETFLAFVQQAATIRESVRGWLYYKALDKARELRRRRARSSRIRPLLHDPEDLDGKFQSRAEREHELLEILVPELRKLPETLLIPTVLHYFCGIPQGEVARILESNPDAIAARIKRARDKMRGGLARRGVAVSACLAAVIAAPKSSSAAALSSDFVQATVKAALDWAAGSTGVPALIPAGLQVPAFSKGIKIGVVLLVLSVGAGLGATLAMLPEPPTEEGDTGPSVQRPEGAQITPRAEEELRLSRERILRDQVAPRVVAAVEKVLGRVHVTQNWIDQGQTAHLLADWQVEDARPAHIDISYEIDRNSLIFRTDLINGEMRHISFEKPIILFRFGNYEKTLTFAETAEICKAFALLRGQED
jgi:RNA polymerase sigma factor (sigma-70 family)